MPEFLPISRADMQRRGWEQCDFVYIIGDGYVDHPSFGHAIISRMLEAHGYKVGIIAQPDWKNQESIQILGEPRLGWLVSAGNMDSMVNHYSVSKKRRAKDSYTPGGEMGKRPDYATIVYSNLIRTWSKKPIILGGIATMGYVINFNNRGYERFKLAYDQVAAGKPDEFNGRYTADYLRKLKNNYRRNRDLCIIITAGLYLLNIIDAHVDAHMKDYDVSDDLSMTLEPTVTNFYTMRTGNSNGYGLSFKLRF